MYDKESSLLWLCVFGPGFTTETVQYNGYRFVLWDLSGSDKNVSYENKNVSYENKNVKYVRSHTHTYPNFFLHAEGKVGSGQLRLSCLC